jgi:hypothetical protein
MANENQNDQLIFICYNCHRENSYKRKKYIDGNEEYFLEAEGNTPTKDVIISCSHCNSKNKVSIPYF